MVDLAMCWGVPPEGGLALGPARPQSQPAAYVMPPPHRYRPKPFQPTSSLGAGSGRSPSASSRSHGVAHGKANHNRPSSSPSLQDVFGNVRTNPGTISRHGISRTPSGGFYTFSAGGHFGYR